jgi:hypothetical protein
MADQPDTKHTERKQIREMTHMFEKEMWQSVGIKLN